MPCGEKLMMLFTRHTGRLVEFSKVDTLEKLVVVNQKNSCVTTLLHTLLHTITLLHYYTHHTTNHSTLAGSVGSLSRANLILSDNRGVMMGVGG